MEPSPPVPLSHLPSTLPRERGDVAGRTSLRSCLVAPVTFPLSRRGPAAGRGGRWERGTGGEDSKRHPLCLVILLLLLGLPAHAQTPDHLSFALEARPLRGLQGPIATLLTTGKEGGGLPMAALAVPAGERGPDGRFAVPLLVEIEGSGLLADRRGDVQRIEIYAYAMGADGSVQDFLAQGLRLDLAQIGEAVLAGGLKFVGTVSMPPGAGSLRVLTIDPDTLRYSLRVLPLTVPSGESGPLLLQPLFSDPRGHWVLARQAGASLALSPLLVDEGWGLPSSLPLLAGGSSRRVALLGRNLPAEPAVTLEIRTEFGKKVQEIPGRVAQRFRTSGPAPERLECDFDLPKLETGRYRAVLTVAGNGARLETPELTVLYLGDNPLSKELIWAQLRRLGAGDDPAPVPVPVPIAEAPKGRKRNAELERIARQGYEDALRALGSGSPLEQVVARLVDVETSIYRQGSSAAADDLRQVELETAERLARSDPEILLPLAVLHAEIYRSLRERKEYFLAENARRTSADLADSYAKKGGSGTVASQTLFILAADLLASGVQGASRELLDRALILDGRNEAVGLFLAASHERDGDYTRTVEVLKQVVQAHPASGEARLRLAVNLGRVGRTAEGQEILRRLIAETGPEWIRTVAWQELVSLHLRHDRPKDAVALLRQAVARLPGQPQLAVQLAFLLDRQGSAAEAQAILDRVRPRANRTAAGSPRHLYGQWPAGVLEEARRSLTQQSLVRLAALSRALDAGIAGPARGGR